MDAWSFLQPQPGLGFAPTAGLATLIGATGEHLMAKVKGNLRATNSTRQTGIASGVDW